MPVHLLVYCNYKTNQSCDSNTTHKIMSKASADIHIKHQNEEICDLGDFDRGMAVCARWAGFEYFIK